VKILRDITNFFLNLRKTYRRQINKGSWQVLKYVVE